MAKNEYRSVGDDFASGSKAEKVTLWYILLDKMNVLKQLYSVEPKNGERYVKLLSRDFSTPKNKQTAISNAGLRVSVKKIKAAAGFYLLGGDLNSAVDVIVARENDPVLATLLCRLVTNQGDTVM